MSDVVKVAAANDGNHTHDVCTSRLKPEQYKANFSDVHPLLNRKNAIIEANRCLFCYDAPCITACPTSIDIPNFIKKISTDNVKGAAKTILEQNIMGGACARVCPVEELCEEACVKNAQNEKPITIGQLQRYATDYLFERDDAQIFQRKPVTGKKVAIVGAGPAGLSCAHFLACEGHDVVIYEARKKAGGLNEHGIAAYKVANNFAQKEIEYILSIGGIDIKYEKVLGSDITLSELRDKFDAVFLAMGLAGVNALGLENEEIKGVENAVEYIEKLRQTKQLETLPVGRRIIVIGGGNTAIDIAIQTKRLGAEDVTLVYRRGSTEMSATLHEQEFAQINGVKIKHWAKPVKLISTNNHIEAVEFEYTELDNDGKLKGTGQTFLLKADMVFKAIGQNFIATPLQDNKAEMLLLTDKGRIDVNNEGLTSLPNVWAGGDCTEGNDLTVVAVEDGKCAALSIHTALSR